jgi:hypothetical protein
LLLQIRHDGQFAHVGHAQIARRVILSQVSRLPRRANQMHDSARPAPTTEGRIAIVTNVGCGMRWTLGIN